MNTREDLRNLAFTDDELMWIVDALDIVAGNLVRGGPQYAERAKRTHALIERLRMQSELS